MQFLGAGHGGLAVSSACASDVSQTFVFGGHSVVVVGSVVVVVGSFVVVVVGCVVVVGGFVGKQTDDLASVCNSHVLLFLCSHVTVLSFQYNWPLCPYAHGIS
jgi:hypothetical protein